MGLFDNFDELQKGFEMPKIKFQTAEIKYEDSAMGRSEKLLKEGNSINQRTAQAVEDIDNQCRELREELSKECAEREKSDKKNFWLGALVSFLIAFFIEYGPEIVSMLK